MFSVKNILTVLAVAFAFTLPITTPAIAQVSVHGGSGLFTVDKARTLGHMNFGLGGFYWSSNYKHTTHNVDESVISAPFTLGISDQFELYAQFVTKNTDGDSYHADADGTSDGLAGAKWNFYNSEKHNMRFSLIGLVTLPMGDKDKSLGTGDTDVGAKLAVDKEYENVSWHLNLGYLDQKSDKLDPELLYGAGVEWFAFGDLSLIAEVSGQAWGDQVAWRDDNSLVSLGVRYYVSDWASVTAGYGSWGGGDGQESPNYMWLAGVTIGRGLGRPKLAGAAGAAEPVAVTEDTGAKEQAVAPVESQAAQKEVVTIILEGIHFKFDSDKLTAVARETLARNAEKLKNNPNVRLVVEGHTCSIGSNGYNAKLGKRRARSAKLFLVKELGIEADRMFVISYGEERPAHTNDTKQGRKLNRRAEFVIQVN